MDLSIIANIDNSIAKNSFLSEIKDKKSSIYYEPDSPLNRAQKASDNLMMTKQRKPMVIEYYKEKGKTESVEMYINPEKLQFQAQKVKQKQYTRGGIFYHHWGDDHPVLSLSGTVGYAGMRGIEQLEKIYAYSGTLLRYKNVGNDVVNNGVQEDYEVLDFNSPFGAVDYIMTNRYDNQKISEVRNNINKTMNDNYVNSRCLSSDLKNAEVADQMMEQYSNLTKLAKRSVDYSEVFLELKNFIIKNNSTVGYTGFEIIYQEAQKRIKNKFKDYHESMQLQIAYDMATILYESDPQNDQSSKIRSGDSYKQDTSDIQKEISVKKSKEIQETLKEIQEFNEKSKITMDEISGALADIQSEIDDEWRPRVVFIYFEDRVFVGHFDSFNYSRVAQHPLINYDMRFTVTRQIVVTSTSPNRVKPSPTIPSRTEPDSNPPMSDPFNDLLEKIRDEARQGKYDLAGDTIMQIKAKWRYEDDCERNKGSKLSSTKANSYAETIKTILEATKVNGKEGLKSNVSFWAPSNWSATDYLNFFKVGKHYNYKFAKDHVAKEYARIRKFVDDNHPGWSNAESKHTKGWIIKVANASGVTNNENYLYLIKKLKL